MDNQFLTTLVLLAVSGSIALTTKREEQAQLQPKGAKSGPRTQPNSSDPVVLLTASLSHCTATHFCRIELLLGP